MRKSIKKFTTIITTVAMFATFSKAAYATKNGSYYFSYVFNGDGGDKVIEPRLKTKSGPAVVYNNLSPCSLYVKIVDSNEKDLSANEKYIFVDRYKQVTIPVSGDYINKKISLKISPSSHGSVSIGGYWNPNGISITGK